MRRAALAAVAALVAVMVVGPATVAGAGNGSGSARDRWWQVYWQRHAEQVQRGLHPAPALSAPTAPGAPAAPTAWTTVKGAKQISQDTSTPRDGSEPDTQVEPYIAMDPNNANHIVAVMQQGRFPDGGSVGPGYATSQDGGKTWVTD